MDPDTDPDPDTETWNRSLTFAPKIIYQIKKKCTLSKHEQFKLIPFVLFEIYALDKN